MKTYLRTGLSIALAFLSVLMIVDGALTYAAMQGVVQGSEFGMLLTLTGKISPIMLWLALFALRWLVVARAQVSDA